MTLTLRIENYDKLEDGGPTWLTLDGKGASVGRRGENDWVLPDPARHISGHHFDITFQGGQYFLTDVSTNGTFLQGQSHRLQGPTALNGGERIVAGHYVIVVEMGAAQASAPPPAATPPMGKTWMTDAPQQASEGDPWDFGGGLDPVNPLPSAGANPHHFDDVAQDFVPLQRPDQAPMPQAAPPVQVPGVHNTGAPIPQQPPQMQPQMHPGPSGPPPQVPPVPQMPPAQPDAAQGYGHPPQTPPPAHPGAVPMPAPAAAPQPAPQPAPGIPPVAPTAAPAPTPAPGSGTGGSAAFIKAFCEGAGLDASRASIDDPEAFARELGKTMRTVTTEVMQMLADRANVKQFTKGGERTMRSAQNNNPMKFLPDADQALEALFIKPRDGFQTGPDGYANALGDLRGHQMAVFAALQPALGEILEGLSPDEIEDEAASTAKLGPSRRGRNWDMYVERWDRKAQAGEHGMLDAFLKAFAKTYAAANAGNTNSE
ncbi:MAG: type VI secretion system-associated FHA domain protein TagH [Maritimibacter sp.]